MASQVARRPRDPVKLLTWQQLPGWRPPLCVSRIIEHGETAMHSHTFWELVLILDGQGTHVVGDEAYAISRGDAFVIEPSEAHGYRDTRGLHLCNILFDRKALHLPVSDLAELPGYHVLMTLEPTYRRRHQFQSRLRLLPEEISSASALLDKMEDTQKQPGPGALFLRTALFMQLIWHLARCYSPRKQASGAAFVQRLGNVMGEIEKNYARPLSLMRLCGISRMSERTFLREFQKSTGLSPIEYLIRRRIAAATERLGNKGLSITRIAFDVGFSDSNYFARQFHKVMKTSPTEYRRRLVH